MTDRTQRPEPWRETEADAWEAKADSIDATCTMLERIEGIFAGQERQTDVHNLNVQLGLDAENFRERAAKLRGGDSV